MLSLSRPRRLRRPRRFGAPLAHGMRPGRQGILREIRETRTLEIRTLGASTAARTSRSRTPRPLPRSFAGLVGCPSRAILDAPRRLPRPALGWDVRRLQKSALRSLVPLKLLPLRPLLLRALPLRLLLLPSILVRALLLMSLLPRAALWSTPLKLLQPRVPRTRPLMRPLRTRAPRTMRLRTRALLRIIPLARPTLMRRLASLPPRALRTPVVMLRAPKAPQATQSLVRPQSLRWRVSLLTPMRAAKLTAQVIRAVTPPALSR